MLISATPDWIAGWCCLQTSLTDHAADSFPKAPDDAELEAAYRFFGNERVTPEAILAPHLRQSAKRSSQHDHVLVVHDTTSSNSAAPHLVKDSAGL
jgi:Transposase DNA-binding